MKCFFMGLIYIIVFCFALLCFGGFLARSCIKSVFLYMLDFWMLTCLYICFQGLKSLCPATRAGVWQQHVSPCTAQPHQLQWGGEKSICNS